ASGNVSGEMRIPTGSNSCEWVPIRINGRADGNKVQIAFDHMDWQGSRRGQATLTLGGAAAAATGPPALLSPDGPWRGTDKCEADVMPRNSAYRSVAFALNLDLRLANGSATWKDSPSESNGFTLEVRVSVEGTVVSLSRFYVSGGEAGIKPATLSGRYDGNS